MLNEDSFSLLSLCHEPDSNQHFDLYQIVAKAYFLLFSASCLVLKFPYMMVENTSALYLIESVRQGQAISGIH